MRRQLFIMGMLGFILFVGSTNWSACTSSQKATTSTEADKAEKPSSPPAFIVAINEKIKGKENLPAEEVFENIEILKGMPASRVLPIMQRAFNKSLGVRCNHCHEFGKWASDVKPTKQIAREMWKMTGQINRELLKNIPNLKSEQAIVNCTTCHRGEVVPAKSLE